MAMGDRVRIGLGTVMFKTVGDMVLVYEPDLGPDGQPQIDRNGCCRMKRAGGIKGGSTGSISGGSVRCHRTDLVEANAPESLVVIGKDFVDMFPVFLDTYQRVGWFPVDHIQQF